MLIENSDDPYMPGIYSNYSSRMVCINGFELGNNTIQFYKHNKDGRFIHNAELSDDSISLYKELVQRISTFKDKSFYKDSAINLSKTYCGNYYVPCIVGIDSTTIKLVWENFKDDSTERMLQRLYSSFFSDSVSKDLNWTKLKKYQFPEYILCAEQFANLHCPEIQRVNPNIRFHEPRIIE